MNTKRVIAAALLAVCAYGSNNAVRAQMPATNSIIRSGVRLNVSAPVKSGNLTVYLIHGKDTMPGQRILTLDEALAQKKLIVHETGSVNELSVENVSNELVFIQSGDIVKGGQQDRTMQYDLIVPPKSGKMSLPSFCVEQGRWSGRGKEAADKFSSAPMALPSKALKIAAKSAGSQSDVWDSVSNVQSKLRSKVHFNPAAMASPTSCELTMEDKNVENATQEHIKKLTDAVKGQDDVIGYGFAINGKINSADVYASHDLFMKLWPKLLKASAVEAVSEEEKGKSFAEPKPDAVQDFISKGQSAKAHHKMASKLSVMDESETKDSYNYSTRLQGATNGTIGPQGADAFVHLNMLSK